jgi:hypothetical protein
MKDLTTDQNLSTNSATNDVQDEEHNEAQQDDYYANHIEFLRNNFSYLVDYKNQTGQLNPIFKLIQQDLFDKDPFVVYGASLIATLAFADKSLYH